MDDILKKFKELTFKEQLGIYAGIGILIGGFLPFGGVSAYGFGVDASLTDWNIGWLGWLGAIAGAVFIYLKQPLNAAIGFAITGLAVLWALVDTLKTEYMGIKFGAFVCIAAAAVGIWATIDALIAKAKEKQSKPS